MTILPNAPMTVLPNFHHDFCIRFCQMLHATMNMIRLPGEGENPFDPNAPEFDYEEKANEWGKKLVDGLNNDTPWMYPEQFKKAPFEYGGIDYSFGNVAALDKIFLNRDIVRIMNEIFDGKEVPKTFSQDALNEMISNQKVNDPKVLFSFGDNNNLFPNNKQVNEENQKQNNKKRKAKEMNDNDIDDDEKDKGGRRT